jgi:proteasome accessory factor B
MSRFQHIQRKLQAGTYPNSASLAAELEVNPKTIKRDVEYMRDRLGFPIEYDAVRHGYYLTHEMKQFPAVAITQGELLALFVAEKALLQYKGTAFEKPLKEAFEKICGGLGEHVTVRMQHPDRDITFRSSGVGDTDLGVFAPVKDALLGRRELSFQYRKLQASTWERRRVQPCHLGCIDHQWYLFAFDTERNGMRTFVLSRMRRPRLLKTKFERPRDFSLATHLDGAFGVYSGGKPHPVVVRFDSFASQLVRERKWHPSQKLRALPDGCVELTVHVGNHHEILRWILGWLHHAEVVSPPALRSAVRNAACRVRDVYPG